MTNSCYDWLYQSLVLSPFKIGPGTHNLQEYTNEYLMVFFFMMVGLEIKEELVSGNLSSNSQRTLPLVATIAGVIVPATIFYYFNHNISENMQGWAIPVVTDIAFAVCIISFFSKSVPKYLKIFLLSLAIFDDLIGIIIIAIFYTTNISFLHLFIAAAIFFLILYCSRQSIKSLSIYLLLGALLWYFIAASGVHSTIAGVLIAFAIPAMPAKKLMDKLGPIVSYIITPLFSFANAGVNLEGLRLDLLLEPLALGIILGLFIGKQIGVFISSWILLKFNLVKLPIKLSLLQLYGVATLTGIGFTVSIFIGDLAFTNETTIEIAKTSIMIGSLLSAICGFAILSISKKQ